MHTDTTAPSPYGERLRPQFHFTARKNWLNDPNGLVYFEGEYHLFFQHNPAGNEWGNMTWGHAVSPDLVHWSQLPNALEPDDHGTIYSGSAVVDARNTLGLPGRAAPLVAIYTAAGQSFTQCIAYSTDRGRSWIKHPGSPVLGQIVKGNRDPKVIWHEPSSRWVMTLFLRDNQFAFFASTDLKCWEHLHDLRVLGCAECPDLFPMRMVGEQTTEKWIWTAADGQYLVGDFDGRQYVPQSGPFRCDWGPNFYAVQTFSDVPDGRRIQMAWMKGGRYPQMPFNQQMSVPVELALRRTPAGLRLFRTPVRQLQCLRGEEASESDLGIDRANHILAQLGGDEELEIFAELDPAGASQIAFCFRGMKVIYHVDDARLSCGSATIPLGHAHPTLRLQLLIDRTSVEAFVNDGESSLSACFVPDAGADRTVQMLHTGPSPHFLHLNAWKLQPAWEQTGAS